ncbi:MAG: FAD-linked oxidoreductase [Desulfobacula sp. GWF2_41_7]|nr:MAG: FAD-linked oxidoreductase [Desulfobacula sp. GWF2_41_7]
MAIERDTIVRELVRIVGQQQVITDEQVLKESSHDRFRKFESIFGVYTRPIPAAVVMLKTTREVSDVLKYLNHHQINCIPRTGGSATEGGLETVVENTVVLDGSLMDRIIKIDPCNMLATAQCGVNLEVLENRLRSQGYTTGHSPQSKPLARMGGLVATRSIGQFSTLYGGIEDMVIGLEAVFPNGNITRIKNVPRRACGPDIRHVIIGNEGALCYITEVTVKIFKYEPENNQFNAYALDHMETGFKILREVLTSGYRPSIARLYDAGDGAQHGFNQFAAGKCVLIFMSEGPALIAKATWKGIEEIVAQYDECQNIDSKIIKTWFAGLNWGPEKIAKEREFIRNNLNMGFTTEVSGNWSCIQAIYENAIKRIQEEFPHAGDLTMLGGHSSHSYQTGTNMYFVYDYNIVDCRPEEEISKYHIPINAIIVEETLKAGGSMVHHHGIGKYRTPWTRDEHGSAYYILKSLKEVFDPNGIMNTGTIFPVEE